MTDPFPSTPATGQPLAYQPISGWAIAGFASGTLFALLVAICAIVALVQGAPVFFPMWILVLALLGVVLSLLGQRQVQNSEGTRAGAGLAPWGLRLSVVSGLCYVSYFYFTGLALQSQANAFLMEAGDDAGFFPLLRDGTGNPAKINAAFLLSRPPSARSGRPDDEKSMIDANDIPVKEGSLGELTAFKENPLVRLLFKQLGKDAEITPLGVLDWKYESRSYRIYRNYRIKTREIDTVYTVATYSVEAEAAGQQRKWFVNMRETTPTGALAKDLTPTGQGMRLLRLRAKDWLDRWSFNLNEGEPFAAIKEVDRTAWDRILVKDDKRDQPRPEDVRDRIRTLVHTTFAANAKRRLPGFAINVRADEVGKWEQVDGKIRTYHFFRFGLPKEPGQNAYYHVEGFAVVETKKALDPATFDLESAPPEWHIVSLTFVRASTEGKFM